MKINTSLLVVLGLVVLAIAGGPAIFFGLVAMGNAGVFENALDNFWLLFGSGLGFILILWVGILYIGNRAITADQDEEQLDG
ncbi:hypothetical protein [uncultured Erythrobacter sp.]|uniref:hypothetical protein n=1 Tax=uncultured Erythrobacter sp. TaxID=263913 RepID=UPI00262631ED|nr:hypothetical protein [uncultured Erythrobacter sp.]